MSLTVVQAASIDGSFGFGSDYNLVNGNTSLLTSSEVEVTNSVVFAGNSATGDFASIFGNADFDVAFNDSIPLTVGMFNITDFLYDFTAVNLFGTDVDLQLAVDLVDITSVMQTANTGLSVLGNVVIRDLSGGYDDTMAALSMEFSEDLGQNGMYNRSMSGNIGTVNVPEPGTLSLILLAAFGFYFMKKMKKEDQNDTSYSMMPA